MIVSKAVHAVTFRGSKSSPSIALRKVLLPRFMSPSTNKRNTPSFNLLLLI